VLVAVLGPCELVVVIVFGVFANTQPLVPARHAGVSPDPPYEVVIGEVTVPELVVT
jgi:hypothetical protein